MADERSNVVTRLRSNPIGLIVCAAGLVLFASLSWTAVRTKNATADEPLHALGAYMRLFHGDFRLNPEDPPLFGYWAMLPHSRSNLRVDLDSPHWHGTIDYMWRQWEWVIPTLYRTPANDPEQFIGRSRAMMLLIAVGLGALISLWSWQAGGALAAVVATALFSLDPNLLGHGPLVKNDVAISLAMLALMFAVWRAGERLTVLSALSVALILALAVNVKFSGLILLPMLAIILLIRAFMPRPWIVLRTPIAGRLGRMMLSAGLLILSGAVSITMIWACYGFRYEPTPDPGIRLNMPLIVKAAARTELLSRDPTRNPSEAEMLEHPPSMSTRTILFADRHQLLPHAWLAGLLDTYATTRVRPTFLNGQTSITGWWYYFPLAMLYKTPLATLAAMLGAAAVGFVLLARGQKPAMDSWTAICLAVPVLIYGMMLLTSNLNLGLRHAFALYPFLFILTAVIIARLWRRYARATTLAGAVLLIGLLAETLFAFPNYIAFFNVAAGGNRGGLRLLGDSNLDWGQDLRLLQRWQRDHPHTPLYLCYFGGIDPSYYVQHISLPGNHGSPHAPSLPSEPGVIAVSATHLQGIYLDPQTARLYQAVQARRHPIAVLGGTIYLFEWR